ncbi:MAG: hypothetical protein NVS3B10_19140 [Polyangiales bacterium]
MRQDLLVASMVLLTVGCGGSPDNGGDATDSGAPTDSTAGDVTDSPRPDTTPEAADSDSAADSGTDSVTDTRADSGPDAHGDADASSDAGDTGDADAIADTADATDAGDTGHGSDASDASDGGDTSDAPATSGPILSGEYRLYGLTSDGWAIAWNNGDASIHAVPIDGGAEQVLARPTHWIQAWTSGRVVFMYDDTASTLSVWSSTVPVRVISTAPKGAFVTSAATREGDAIVWYDVASASTVNLRWARTDGSASLTVVAGTTACNDYPRGAPGRVLTPICTSASSGAGGAFSIASIDAATGAATTLVSAARGGWATDPAGALVFASTATDAKLYPTDGSAPLPVEAGIARDPLFTADGANVLYDADGPSFERVLRRAPVATGTPTTITSTIGRLEAVSADGAFAAYSVVSSSTGPGGDLWSVSTADGVKHAVAATTTNAPVASGFTTDGQYLLFNPSAAWVPDAFELDAYPTAGGAVKTLAYSADAVTALGGSKVLYTVYGTTGDDLDWVDVSASSTFPTSIASDVQKYFITSARDRIVYAKQYVAAGIYVVPVP